MIHHALKYAAGGIHVFPIKPRGKTPITQHGCLDATDDAEQIAAWWDKTPDANIGVATGPTSGLLVVDLDGPEAENSWTAILSGRDATTAEVATSNGRHLYYRTALTVGNTAKKLGPGIDTRGRGGYVVAPPSIHPSGVAYAWLNRVRVAQAPAWLEQILNPPPAPPRHLPSPHAGAAVDAYGRAALTRILDELARSGQGTRNDALNRAAYQCGRLIAAGRLTHAIAEADLEHTALAIGLDQHETAATIRSGITSGTNNPAQPRPVDLDAPRMTPPRDRAPRDYATRA